jgi:VTC domain
MADTREVRTFATEVKFLVDPRLAAAIRHWARIHLSADPHGSGPCGDEYLTTSVYFDNESLDVFHRRGSFGRSKYRIRRYGVDETVFLERKLREPTVLAKRRTMAPLTALERLEAGQPATAWSGHWFHARLAARRLRPVCQVSYRRTARLTTVAGDLVRLTLDDGLAAQPSRHARFHDSQGVPVIDGRQILELKFRHETPSLFKQLVEEFRLTPAPASKYRLGMAATGQATAVEVPAGLAAGGAAAAEVGHA